MNGNVSTIEGLKQCCELVGSVAKAMALLAPGMSKEQRQALIGMPPTELALVLEKVLCPVPAETAALTRSVLPLWYSRNEHGHIVFKVSGCNHLTGEWVIENGGRHGHSVAGKARSCLLSRAVNSFNHQAQLPALAAPYQVVLMPVRKTDVFDLKLKALREHAYREYRYQTPPVGLLPLLFVELTKEQLIELGFDYIGSPSASTDDDVGTPFQFFVKANQFGLCLDATIETTNSIWNPGGALAFLAY